MSIFVELSKLDKNILKKIENEIKIEISNNYVYRSRNIFCYKIHQENIGKKSEKIHKILYIPFDVALNNGILPRKRNEFSKVNINLFSTFKLRDYQKDDKNLALDYLNKRGNCILSLYTGYGKTKLSIYLAIKLKLKTMFICKNVTILSQIKKSIEEMCDAKVEKIEPKNYKDKNSLSDADIFLVNPINIPKFPHIFYKDIGTVICDECHQIAAEKLSSCLTYIAPRYLIGLSATPYREDNCDKILDIYFGKNKIIKNLNRYHKYHSIFTGKRYNFGLNSQGRVDWGDALEQLSSDKQRNENICKLANKIYCKTDEDITIIFCKRKSQADFLHKILEEEYGIITDVFYGSKKTYKPDCKILITIVSKAGVGFDDPRVTKLILATDVQSYFSQILGRIFRKEDTIPEVFDIVDSNPLLMRHYRTRENVSIEKGGEIFTYSEWKDILDGEIN